MRAVVLAWVHRRLLADRQLDVVNDGQCTCTWSPIRRWACLVFNDFEAWGGAAPGEECWRSMEQSRRASAAWQCRRRLAASAGLQSRLARWYIVPGDQAHAFGPLKGHWKLARITTCGGGGAGIGSCHAGGHGVVFPRFSSATTASLRRLRRSAWLLHPPPGTRPGWPAASG